MARLIMRMESEEIGPLVSADDFLDDLQRRDAEWDRQMADADRLDKRRTDAIQWHSDNKDKVNKGVRRRYAADPSKVKARRALKKHLCHPECDTRAVITLCKKAIAISKESGMKFVVDHIIPLKHGGWHHHLNLQVIPESVNCRKSCNPLWEMAGYKSWRDVPRALWPDQLRRKYLTIISHE